MPTRQGANIVFQVIAITLAVYLFDCGTYTPLCLGVVECLGLGLWLAGRLDISNGGVSL